MYYQLYLPSSVFNPFTNYENPDNNVWNPYGTRMEPVWNCSASIFSTTAMYIIYCIGI